MPTEQLLEAIREFTTAILNPYDLQDLLHRLLDHTTIVTGAQGAGIMLEGRDGLGFAAASDDLVIDVEVTQDRVESGPCHEAFRTNEIVAVDDLSAEDRWPAYRQRATELGFQAVVGIPLNAWGRTIGVLDLYRRAAGPLDDAEVDAAEIMATMGAGYILHAHQSVAQHELATQLQSALESRDTIGQAKGILMARHGVDADEAFGMLRTLSQRTNHKLRDVARDLVEGGAAAGTDG
jgi:GAF domain-containing protein